MKKVLVVIGSVREGRRADTILKLVTTELEKRPQLEVSIADFKDIQLPFYNHPKLPGDADFSTDNEHVLRWYELLEQSDGFIFLTPEYNHTTSAVLKNAIDWAYHQWSGKPVAFVGWGSVGGSRSVEHLLQIVPRVGLVAIHRPVLIIPSRDLDENGQPLSPATVSAINGTLDKLEEALA